MPEKTISDEDYVKDNVDLLRTDAFKRLARFMADPNPGEETWATDGEFFGDLTQWSPYRFDTYQREHDHWRFTFHPSLGNEARYQTLHVITAHDPYNQLPKFQITAMVYVFDTEPAALFVVREGKDRWVDLG